MHAYRAAPDAPSRLKLITAMSRMSGEAVWRGIRLLAANERDERTRAQLVKAEEAVRDRDNTATQKQGWNAASGDARLREKLWAAFRARSRGR